MASGNLPPQRREIVVRGDVNCFYRAIALWRDEMTDEKYDEIRRLSSSLIEKNPKIFEPLLFSSNSVEDHDHGNLGRNCGHIQLCIAASATNLYLLNKTEKWFNFKQIMNTHSFSSITIKKQCRSRILCFSGYLRSLSQPHTAQCHLACSNIILITELRNSPKASCTHVNTTVKGLLSYYIPIYT